MSVIGALATSDDSVKALAAETVHDRLTGTLFGSALGDAVGLYTEFLSGDLASLAYPSRVFKLSPPSEVTPFRRDAHRNPHAPGEWTDDTDHAMLILLAFLHSNGAVEPTQLAARLSTWCKVGLLALDTLPLGLGRTVGAIVRSKEYLEDPEETARAFWVNGGYSAAPNGSLMRTHPLGLMCLNRTVRETMDVAAEYSSVTHVDPRCLISCAVGSALIRGLVRGEVREEKDIDDMIDLAISWFGEYRQKHLQADPSRKDEPDLDVQEFQAHAKVASLDDLKLDEAYKIGYVYKTFGAGIHLLRVAMRQRTTTKPDGSTMAARLSAFEPLITDLIMQAGDADTNACFAGALLGAYLGYRALPQNWRDGLKHGAWLLQKAEALSILMGVTPGWYDGKQDRDTAPEGPDGYYPTEAQMEDKAMRLQAWMVKEEQEWKRREENEKKAKQKAKEKSWFSWKS